MSDIDFGGLGWHWRHGGGKGFARRRGKPVPRRRERRSDDRLGVAKKKAAGEPAAGDANESRRVITW